MTDGDQTVPDGGRGFQSRIDRMQPVGLDEVNRDAELQTRTDRKYAVSDAHLDALINEFGDRCSVLQLDGRRRFSYSTTYHDTPDRRLYLDTAHRRPTRFKVRVREYVDTGLAMLEVKAKSHSSNISPRKEHYRLDPADNAPPST